MTKARYVGDDPLANDYGVILAQVGPTLMERAHWFREMADLIKDRLGSGTKVETWLRDQADRADEIVVSLGRKIG